MKRKKESGATAIEYGLIASLIAVVVVSSIAVLGQKGENGSTPASSSTR
jgi:Flp pilus assembly pilin Flp